MLQRSEGIATPATTAITTGFLECYPSVFDVKVGFVVVLALDQLAVYGYPITALETLSNELSCFARDLYGVELSLLFVVL